LAKTRRNGLEETLDVTVKEALERGIVRSEWQAFFMAMAKKLLVEIGIPAEKQRFIEKLPWEKAHYSSQSFDQEVHVERWGWVEVSGHAYRTDYDLSSHMKVSGADMRVYKEYEKPIEKEQVVLKPVLAKLGPAFKKEAARIAEFLSKAEPEQVAASLKEKGYYTIAGHNILPEHVEISHQKTIERGKRFVPHVVEPSFGSDRLFYVALEYAYGMKDDRVVMSFPRSISPIQVGVYPLVSKDGLVEKAERVRELLAQDGFTVEFDETGSIGRRYARADEAGIPLGMTIDYDTLTDGTVTIRDRDSWRQVRTPIKDLPELMHKFFQGKINFVELGTLFGSSN
jgi:glycyl-tRNA synthetase